MELSYTISRRKVKNARLEFGRQGLSVIIPAQPDFNVEQFLARHHAWIAKQQQYFSALEQQLPALPLANRSNGQLAAELETYLMEIGNYLRVRPAKVVLRKLRSRWGSCSSQRVITFSLSLRQLPGHLVRYVDYHEMCHLRVMRHGKRFKALMQAAFPDMKRHEQELNMYWHALH